MAPGPGAKPWSKKQGVTAIVIVVTVCTNGQQVLQGLQALAAFHREAGPIYPKWRYPNSWMVYNGRTYENGNLWKWEPPYHIKSFHIISYHTISSWVPHGCSFAAGIIHSFAWRMASVAVREAFSMAQSRGEMERVPTVTSEVEGLEKAEAYPTNYKEKYS